MQSRSCSQARYPCLSASSESATRGPCAWLNVDPVTPRTLSRPGGGGGREDCIVFGSHHALADFFLNGSFCPERSLGVWGGGRRGQGEDQTSSAGWGWGTSALLPCLRLPHPLLAHLVPTRVTTSIPLLLLGDNGPTQTMCLTVMNTIHVCPCAISESDFGILVLFQNCFGDLLANNELWGRTGKVRRAPAAWSDSSSGNYILASLVSCHFNQTAERLRLLFPPGWSCGRCWAAALPPTQSGGSVPLAGTPTGFGGQERHLRPRPRAP